MQRRRFVAGFLVFTIGFAVLAAGICVLLYERAIRQAAAAYGADKSFDARSILERLVELPFSDPRVRYNLGLAFLKGAEFDKAMAQFRRMAAESPDPKLRAQAYYLMAWTKVREVHSKEEERKKNPFYYAWWRPDTSDNDYKEALAHLEEAMRFDPSHKGAKNLYERIRHLFKQPSPSKGQKLKQDPGRTPGTGSREPKP